jgi:hypothetical protein
MNGPKPGQNEPITVHTRRRLCVTVCDHRIALDDSGQRGTSETTVFAQETGATGASRKRRELR